MLLVLVSLSLSYHRRVAYHSLRARLHVGELVSLLLVLVRVLLMLMLPVLIGRVLLHVLGLQVGHGLHTTHIMELLHLWILKARIETVRLLLLY